MLTAWEQILIRNQISKSFRMNLEIWSKIFSLLRMTKIGNKQKHCKIWEPAWTLMNSMMLYSKLITNFTSKETHKSSKKEASTSEQCSAHQMASKKSMAKSYNRMAKTDFVLSKSRACQNYSSTVSYNTFTQTISTSGNKMLNSS